MWRKKLCVGVAILAAGAAILGSSIFWRAGSTLAKITAQVASEGNLRVSVGPWVKSVPAGLELVGSAAQYTDAQVFHGHLYLAGPTGLSELDSSGDPIARYRAGIELPPAPVTALAVGLVGDSSAPELWIATAG